VQVNIEKEFLERINAHKGILFKIAKMYVDEKADQEDLYQELVCQLWKSYGSFRGESQFSTWMYRVSLNTAITYFKKESKVTKVTFRLSTESNQVAAEDKNGAVEVQVSYLYIYSRCLFKYKK